MIATSRTQWQLNTTYTGLCRVGSTHHVYGDVYGHQERFPRHKLFPGILPWCAVYYVVVYIMLATFIPACYIDRKHQAAILAVCPVSHLPAFAETSR